MKPYVIGVTGVIGSGKSTVCCCLKEHFGFHWIDADEITHELYKVGQPGYKKIREYFGEQFVGQSEVNRGRLRQLILKSQQKLWILNKLMHSLVAHEVNKKVVQLKRLDKGKNQHSICIEAVYFEPNDLGKFIDQLIVIDASDEVIMKRLMADKKRKDIPLAQLRKLLLFQRKNMAKIGTIIKNDATLGVLINRLEEVFG